MIFEKIRETFRNIHRVVQCDEDLEWNRAVYKCTTIVDEVEAEYNNDMVYQLAMKYALCLTQYGVDITEKLETATQNAMALEQAYIRGRQDECDKFSEWRDRHNNGWISVDDKLPEDASYVLVAEDDDVYMAYYDEKRQGWYYDTEEGLYRRVYVDAWMPLPEPYTPKGE